jgi:hypothetical protein
MAKTLAFNLSGMGRQRLRKPQESVLMPKRSRTLRPAQGKPARPVGRKPRPGIVHTSLYLPEAVYEALREIAFDERAKIHDLVLEGIELALRKRGYPSIGDLKAKHERKGR